LRKNVIFEITRGFKYLGWRGKGRARGGGGKG
jgi:hypothetical protein